MCVISKVNVKIRLKNFASKRIAKIGNVTIAFKTDQF